MQTCLLFIVMMTGSSKLFIFIGCSETDVISDSILPKPLSSSVELEDLKYTDNVSHGIK